MELYALSLAVDIAEEKKKNLKTWLVGILENEIKPCYSQKGK